MKKNLFYLFIALFAVTFMTACGDDDDDKFTSEGGTKMSVEEFLRKNPGRMN